MPPRARKRQLSDVDGSDSPSFASKEEASSYIDDASLASLDVSLSATGSPSQEVLNDNYRAPTTATRVVTKRSQLSARDKLTVIEWYHAQGKNQKATAEHFKALPGYEKLSQSSVSRYITGEAKIRALVESGRADVVRVNSVRNPDFEHTLVTWLDRVISSSNTNSATDASTSSSSTSAVRLSGDLIKQTAAKVYDHLGTPESERLELSNGWLRSFQIRHGLRTSGLKQRRSLSDAVVATSDSVSDHPQLLPPLPLSTPAATAAAPKRADSDDLRVDDHDDTTDTALGAIDAPAVAATSTAVVETPMRPATSATAAVVLSPLLAAFVPSAPPVGALASSSSSSSSPQPLTLPHRPLPPSLPSLATPPLTQPQHHPPSTIVIPVVRSSPLSTTSPLRTVKAPRQQPAPAPPLAPPPPRASVSNDVLKCEQERIALRIRDFLSWDHRRSVRDVWSLDALEFAFAHAPRVVPPNAPSSTASKSKSKQRFTVALATNVDGSERRTPLLVSRGRSEHLLRSPAAAAAASAVSVAFVANRHAALTPDALTTYLATWNAELVASQRHVLVLVDSTIGDNVETLDMTNIQLECVSADAGVADLVHPFRDAVGGIARAFKASYRRLVVLRAVDFVLCATASTSTSLESVDVDAVAAIELVGRAWPLVASETIARCWRNARILPTDQSNARIDVRPSALALRDIAALEQALTLLATEARACGFDVECLDAATFVDVDARPLRDAVSDDDDDDDDAMDGRSSDESVEPVRVYQSLLTLEQFWREQPLHVTDDVHKLLQLTRVELQRSIRRARARQQTGQSPSYT